MTVNQSLSQDKWQKMRAIVLQFGKKDYPINYKKLILTRLLTANIFICLLQYVGLMFSTLSYPMAPAWLASGTTCAFVFLRGFYITPGILLGSFFAFYFAEFNFLQASAAALIIALQSVALIWLCYRFISPLPIFYQQKLFNRFIFIASLLTAITSYCLLLVCFANYISPSLYLRSWLANFNGMFILTCVIVTWDVYFAEINSWWKHIKLKICILYGILFLLILLFTINTNIIFARVLSIAIVAYLFYCAQLGWCANIFANFLVAMLLCVAAYVDAPLFAVVLNSKTLLLLEIIMALTAILTTTISIKNIKVSDL